MRHSIKRRITQPKLVTESEITARLSEILIISSTRILSTNMQADRPCTSGHGAKPTPQTQSAVDQTSFTVPVAERTSDQQIMSERTRNPFNHAQAMQNAHDQVCLKKAGVTPIDRQAQLSQSA